jgi:uncharacterized protein (TIGR02594 family)
MAVAGFSLGEHFWRAVDAAGQAMSAEPQAAQPFQEPALATYSQDSLPNFGGLPWMFQANSLMGTREWSGEANNPIILKWAVELGGEVQRDYRHDSIPWCGLFTAIVAKRSGLTPPVAPLWALNWAKWEAPVEPAYGAWLAFSRSGGGHVGFYVGEDAYAYHVLGGNQSDMVNITRVSKSQLRGSRWPKAYLNVYTGKKIRRSVEGSVASSGQLG